MVPEPEDVTPEWLTSALRRNGVISSDQSVAAIEAVRVGDGISSRSFRFSLEWDEPSRDAPSSLVGKFASAEARGLATARATGTYQRELRFYRDLAPSIAAHCPRPFVAEFDATTGRFVLLLEDLSGSRQGDQVAGCTVDEARLAMQEAARLHASRWDDPALDNLRYLIRHLPGGWVSKTLASLWPQFLRAYGDRLPPGAAEVGTRLVNQFESYLSAGTAPRCLIHLDYRLDNMLFGAPPLAVIDWQTVGQGPALWDVAYFLGTAFASGRAVHETALLRSYHDDLVAHGVDGYDFDRCRDDYRRYTLGAAALTVVACVAIPASDKRAEATFGAMVERQFQQVLELGAVEFLA